MSPDRYTMMNMIQQLQFMAVELNLYLNTHPCDTNAIREYNNYSERLRSTIAEYEQVYGPILGFGQSKNNDPNTWRWIYEPWPWENVANQGGMR